MKTSITCAVSILLASVVCYAENKSTAQAGNFVNLNFTVDGVERVVALYIPEGYDKTKKWPLIIYLHGDNQGNAVNDWLNKQPIVRAIRKKSKRFPALVLIPRCPKGKV